MLQGFATPEKIWHSGWYGLINAALLRTSPNGASPTSLPKAHPRQEITPLTRKRNGMELAMRVGWVGIIWLLLIGCFRRW